MDFAENYEIVFGIEVQSEHWNHESVTLFMVIYDTRHPTSLSTQTKAIVFVSSDKKHDTYAVQHFMTAMKEHFATKGQAYDRWFIDSDGAGSHFKNNTPFNLDVNSNS